MFAPTRTFSGFLREVPASARLVQSTSVCVYGVCVYNFFGAKICEVSLNQVDQEVIADWERQGVQCQPRGTARFPDTAYL